MNFSSHYPQFQNSHQQYPYNPQNQQYPYAHIQQYPQNSQYPHHIPQPIYLPLLQPIISYPSLISHTQRPSIPQSQDGLQLRSIEVVTPNQRRTYPIESQNRMYMQNLINDIFPDLIPNQPNQQNQTSSTPTSLQYLQDNTEVYVCNENTQCSICRNSLQNTACRRLSCNHSFHVNCIDRWFCTSSSCPLCREEMTSQP